MLRILPILLLVACAGCVTPGNTHSTWNAWAQHQGGLLHDQRETRAITALAKLRAGSIRGNLTIHVLDSNTPTAYAWPSGDIFVTRALLDVLPSDDELTAAIAHEVGHLVADGHCRTIMTLGGSKRSGQDAEARADDLARHLLQTAGLPSDSLLHALQKVQASPRLSASCRCGLQHRIERLSTHRPSVP
ncbi:MAG: M48 family metalloprotease [Bacillota bacterium]